MTANPNDLPVLPESDLEILERLFPPRCLEEGESVDQHLRYAGRVGLVSDLRAARQRTIIATDDLDGEIRKALAEKE